MSLRHQKSQICFFSEESLGDLDISVGINPRLLENLHYIVELQASLTSKFEDENVFCLNVTYSSFGRILEENPDDNQLTQF